MKKTAFLIGFAVCVIVFIVAEERLNIFKTDHSVVSLSVSNIDSIKFSENNSKLNIYKTDNSVSNFLVVEIDSIDFTGVPDTIQFVYNGNSVSVNNKLAGKGVDITIQGADVTVNSTLTENEVKYVLSGNSTDGSFKIYSSLRFELILNGVTLANSDGPAINIQSGKHIDVTLPEGKVNTIADGITYTPGSEDQKGTFFSEGQLIFNGTGSLTVTGNNNHAICSDDYIEIENGNISVLSAVKDAIHSKGHFKLEAGTLNLTASNDAIQTETGEVKIKGGNLTTINAVADGKGINCDSTLSVSGGTIKMTVGGNKSKGIKSGDVMNLSGGIITINTTGAASLSTSGSGYEPSYCTAIKCDTVINITGTSITITATGVGGKGISSDNNINVAGGTINVTNSGNGATYTNNLGVLDAYTGSAIEADGNITIAAGNITIVSSGTGAKGISADGAVTFGDATNIPVVNISNTGTKLLVSGTANYTTAVYAEPKNIKSDGNLTFNSGTYTITCTQQGSELIDCDAVLNINGGTFTMTLGGNQSKGIKSTGAMNLLGGTIGITATGGVTLENVAASTYDPSYCTAIKSSGIITVNGSNITLTHNGAGSKGISGDVAINIISGTVKVTTSGAGATYKNSSNVTDAYSAACITTDTNLSITGGSVTCSSSGTGGKGISTTGTVTIGSTNGAPTVNLTTSGTTFTVSGSDLCHPKTIVATGEVIINNGINTISSNDDGIKSETNITINGGTTTISKATEGIEAKVITINGGNTYVSASDDGINTTASTKAGGVETDDGSYFYMYGGLLTTVASSGDALDSNGKILMTGGVLVPFGPSNTTNEDIDSNGSITINGGLLFGGCMASGMFESIASAIQVGANLKSSAAISTASGYIQIKDASGTEIGTFITPRAFYYFHISSPAMKTSTSYSIYTGGTYTGGTTTGGYCTGGVYSGGTLKKSFTTSTSKVSTITL